MGSYYFEVLGEITPVRRGNVFELPFMFMDGRSITGTLSLGVIGCNRLQITSALSSGGEEI